MASFATTSFADCVAIANLFERYPLRAKKRYDFAIWAKLARYAFETYKPVAADVAEDLAEMRRLKVGPYRDPVTRRMIAV